MSADNGIYILHTKETHIPTLFDENTGIAYGWNNLFQKIDVYRVSHTQGVDNFHWYKENELHMLGYFMMSVWEASPMFYTKEDAFRFAVELEDVMGYTEYGIGTIDATKYPLNSTYSPKSPSWAKTHKEIMEKLNAN